MRITLKKFIYLMISFTLLALSGNGVVSAQNVTATGLGECTPVDIVFVIDQGNDMVDFDPEDTRLTITEWMIGVLGYDYLTSCPNSTHNISVVSFGGENQRPKVDIPLTPLNPISMTGEDGWISNLKNFQLSIYHQDLSGRDFISALNKAASILGEKEAGRKQIIVMLAGNAGIPCSSLYDYYTCCYEDYMKGVESEIFQEIQSFLTDDLPFTDDIGPYVYILSDTEFRDKYIDSIDSLQENIVDVWNSILGERGEMALINSDLDLAEALMDIFLQHSEHSEVESIIPGDVYIDPFVESILIFGYRSDCEKTVEIEWIHENVQSSSSTGGENREVYTIVSAFDESEESHLFYYYIEQPPPGKWKISGAGAEYWLFVEPASKISVMEPSISFGQYSDQGEVFDSDDPHYFTFSVIDDENLSMRQFSDYPATVKGSVEKPNGEVYDLTFTFDNAVNAFVSNEALHVDRIGTYEWKISISITPSQPGSDDSFELIQSSGTYAVNEVTPITIQILEPSSEEIPLHGSWFSAWDVQPLEVTAQLVDQDGNFLSARDVFTDDLDSALSLTVTDEIRDISEEFPLEFLLTDDSMASGEITPEIFSTEGAYLIEINLNGDINRNLYRWTEVAIVKYVDRVDSALTNKTTYIGLGVFLILCLITGIALLIYIYTNPIKGRLVFSFDRAGEMRPFDDLDLERNKRRFLNIKESKIKESLSRILHYVKKIKIYRNGTKGDLYLRIYEDPNQSGNSEMREVSNVASSPVHFDKNKGIFISYLCDENGEEN